jgi:hypothetical protein
MMKFLEGILDECFHDFARHCYVNSEVPGSFTKYIALFS